MEYLTAVIIMYACSYKVTGQYNLPPDTHIPDSAASMAQLPPTASPMDLIGLRPEAPPPVPRSSVEQALGRWELEVNAISLHCALLTCNAVQFLQGLWVLIYLSFT